MADPVLPLELVDAVLKHLEGRSHQSLVACALVCRSWLPIAYTYLFRDLSFCIQSSGDVILPNNVVSNNAQLSTQLARSTGLSAYAKTLSVVILSRDEKTMGEMESVIRGAVNLRTLKWLMIHARLEDTERLVRPFHALATATSTQSNLMELSLMNMHFEDRTQLLGLLGTVLI
jgi:hypothetical protein